MQYLINLIQNTFGIDPEVQKKILITLIIIILFWLLKFIFNKIIRKKVKDPKLTYIWLKTIHYIIMFIVILVLVNIWLKGIKSINTFLGLLSAGVAIALKDLLINISGWFFIFIRKPFILGDRIQIGNDAGDVIDIRSFNFSILEIGNWVDSDQSTGRVIHVPNGKIFTENVFNYTQGFQYIWHEIPVLITFESNWKKAKKILLTILNTKLENISEKMEKELKKSRHQYLIYYKKFDPIVYTTVKDSGILLTLRFLCDPRKRRGYEQLIWENILLKFKQNKDIDFAYTTYRIFDNIKEGKKEE